MTFSKVHAKVHAPKNGAKVHARSTGPRIEQQTPLFVGFSRSTARSTTSTLQRSTFSPPTKWGETDHVYQNGEEK